MEKLVLLLGAFALIGCGEKKSTDSAEGSQKAGPVQEAKEEVEVASSGPEPLVQAPSFLPSLKSPSRVKGCSGHGKAGPRFQSPAQCILI